MRQTKSWGDDDNEQQQHETTVQDKEMEIFLKKSSSITQNQLKLQLTDQTHLPLLRLTK